MTNVFADSFREEDLLRSGLLDQGVHPDDLAALLRYVPQALTHLTWRNTVLEDWHGDPDSRISDAEMMRANVATTRIFHQAIWFGIGELWADRGPLSIEMVGVDELDVALADALETAFDHERLLPHGITLGELGGDEYPLLRDHAEQQLDALLLMADEHGAHRVLMWLGLRGVLSVSTWWGTPKWPFIVDEFFRCLDDPEHNHWGAGGYPGPPPPSAGDRATFRKLLLSAPDELPNDAVSYCINRAGLGFITA